MPFQRIIKTSKKEFDNLTKFWENLTDLQKYHKICEFIEDVPFDSSRLDHIEVNENSIDVFDRGERGKIVDDESFSILY